MNKPMQHQANKPLVEFFQLNPDDSTPLYMQLQSQIRSAAEQDLLKVGEALMPERELAELTGVSRITVKKAIEGLVKEGLFVQRRGAGTFLVKSANGLLDQSLTKLRSFSEDILSRGMRPDSTLIARELTEATPEEVFALNLSLDATVIRLTRVRLADDEPMAFEVAVIPNTFLSSPEAVDKSLYEALEQRGFRPVRALQRLQAISIGETEAQYLDTTVGSAALYIERRAFTAAGAAVEFTRSYYRGDRYDFVAELNLKRR